MCPLAVVNFSGWIGPHTGPGGHCDTMSQQGSVPAHVCVEKEGVKSGERGKNERQGGKGGRAG
jgi:hypothetical protein